MPPASEMRADRSMEHILNAAGQSTSVEEPSRTAEPRNAEDPDDIGNSYSAVRRTIEVDNTENHMSEGGRDDGDTEEDSEASSEVPFDTQPTVFSDEENREETELHSLDDTGAYRCTSEAPVQDRPPAIAQERLVQEHTTSPEQSFQSDTVGAAGQEPTRHHFICAGPRKVLGKHPPSSPTPEFGEGANPRPRKLLVLSHTESLVAGRPLRRAEGTKERYPEDISNLGSQHETNTQKLAQLGIPSAPLVLSPSNSHIYIRRQSTSPVRVPALATPRDRDLRIYHTPSPQPQAPEINNKSFNVFTALLDHPELVIEVSKHLEIDNLVDLYAISRDYHALVDNRFTSLIMGQAIGKASESARTFPFRAYRNLCKRDPAGRIMLFNISEREGIERVATAKDRDVRFVPSIRWLRMILHHEAVVDRILGCLAQEGHRLPKRTTLVLKKLWFTLDITDNGRRIGVLHDTRFWSNKDIFLATMFFVKLDMRLTDPTTGDGEMGLRKLLLAQKSLETLARVLAREELRSQLEMLRMVVRFDYVPSRPLQNGETVFGVQAEEVGKLCYEGRGRGERKLVPIDELIGREAVRRRLTLQHHYIDMMLYGYVNKRTFQDVRTPMDLVARDSSAREGLDDKTETEASTEDTEEEYERRMENDKRDRMGLFWGETDEEDEGAGDEQEQEASLDEQGLNFENSQENDIKGTRSVN